MSALHVYAILLLLANFMGLVIVPVRAAEAPFIIVQSTTSTQNSGLLDAIIPEFTAVSGIDVRIVSVGTGQAIRNASNGDGDVLLVHAKEAEEKFVADGWGVERFDVMYNDFILIGPSDDPAGVAATEDILGALRNIASGKTTFVSRGDDSGTHKAELALWKAAGADAPAASGSWYRESGSGMGATLNIGTAMNAYVLTDRASWIAFGNKGDYQIAVQGDDRLFNQYGVILVNPLRHANVKASEGQEFIDWLTSVAGQQAIADFHIGGEQLFFPNANRAASGKNTAATR